MIRFSKVGNVIFCNLDPLWRYDSIDLVMKYFQNFALSSIIIFRLKFNNKFSMMQAIL